MELLELLREIHAGGCVANVTTYSIVISGLVKSNRLNQRLYYNLVSRDFSPSPCTYGPVLDGLSKAGKVDEATDLFEEMLEYGIEPSCATCNILMNGFGKIGDVVCEFLDRMQRERILPYSGLEPDLVSYNLMITVLGASGRPLEALLLFKEMQIRGVSPDLYTYNMAGNADDAYEVYKSMMGIGLGSGSRSRPGMPPRKPDAGGSLGAEEQEVKEEAAQEEEAEAVTVEGGDAG
ncbi:hypothetical protein EJ110_NYTH13290 [Nymphaea thermarum]|nr:hypothetical protein EJ110_NYTH13290 [Nymphaea thermarum]